MLPLNKQRARHGGSLVPLKSTRARALASGRYTGALLELMTSARGLVGLAAGPCKSCRTMKVYSQIASWKFHCGGDKRVGPHTYRDAIRHAVHSVLNRRFALC